MKLAALVCFGGGTSCEDPVEMSLQAFRKGDGLTGVVGPATRAVPIGGFLVRPLVLIGDCGLGKDCVAASAALVGDGAGAGERGRAEMPFAPGTKGFSMSSIRLRLSESGEVDSASFSLITILSGVDRPPPKAGEW